MEEKKKPKYNMLQNTWWMVKLGFQYIWQVPISLLFAVAVAVALNLTELWIAPVILKHVESGVPLGTLLQTILLFALALVLLTALSVYLRYYPDPGLIAIRNRILTQVQQMAMTMAYPMTEDPEVRAHMKKATDSCSNNYEATEDLWRTLRDLLRDLAGFAVYLMLLANVDPVLLLVVLVTATVGYFSTKRINEWGYRHREEENAIDSKLGYMKWQASERKLGKDIRIFGMAPWLKDIYATTQRAYEDFAAREQRAYFWGDLIDLFLAFARNGIAYFYLISMTLREGLPASQFLLLFTAIGGFTTWVTGILGGFIKLHKQSLDLSTLREFVERPEPFLYDEGKALPPQTGGSYTLELKNVSFRYPGAEKDTLRNINLTIPAGEKLAIVGLNGAGKTTLIKLLCGFYDPTEGAVLLNGEDIRQFNRRDYYAHFAAVFQQFSVLDV